MTIIEFFDKKPIENIAGALLCEPDRVLFVGHNGKKINRSIDTYNSILKNRALNVTLDVFPLGRNNLSEIVEGLEEIVNTYDDCVFDLTGGEDLYLVAVGIIMERFGDRVQCHRFNFNNNSLIDCDRDGNVCSVLHPFELTVDENIILHGGFIVTDPEQEFYTYAWDLNDDLARDVESAWDIGRKDARLWNAQIGTLDAACHSVCLPEDSLDLCFDPDYVDYELRKKNKKYKYVLFPSTLKEFQQLGLIRNLSLTDKISFSFKNIQVKKLLTVAGQLLELVVAYAMKRLKNKDGTSVYRDVMVGVVIDWDGDNEQTQKIRTINEIDVMAMRGTEPIFISCKNGEFDANELYKLTSVADQFGGDRAKRVLVASELDKLTKTNDFLEARITDMGIKLIQDVDSESDAYLEDKLRNI